MWDELWDEVDWDAIMNGGGTDDFSEWVPSGDFPMTSDLDEWTPPIQGGDGLDWKFPTGLGDSGGLLKGLSGLFGKDGAMGAGSGLSSLLAALGMGYGGYKGNQASKESAEEIKAASKEANANAANLIGGAQGNFQPYIDTGKNALSDLYALTQQPGLAGKFGPLKAKDMPKMKGSISLAELARK
jgi:hypothetical protein